jgi:ketosteroid isomerase-like protein
MRLIHLALFAAVTQTACAASAPPADAKADEAAIRSLEEQWSAAANKKDLEGTLSFYSASGATMWPDAPASHGVSEIRAAWTEMFKIPGISLKFLPDKIVIAQSGDMATDEGRAVVGMTTPAGPSVDTSKYLVIWKKENGTWKVAYDAYNSNKPAPAPAPAVKKG